MPVMGQGTGLDPFVKGVGTTISSQMQDPERGLSFPIEIASNTIPYQLRGEIRSLVGRQICKKLEQKSCGLWKSGVKKLHF
jgi:hypothetical protein